jgi:hypothetical protein
MPLETERNQSKITIIAQNGISRQSHPLKGFGISEIFHRDIQHVKDNFPPGEVILDPDNIVKVLGNLFRFVEKSNFENAFPGPHT